MPQTSVLDNPGRAYAGQIAESGAKRYSRSAKAEGTLVAGQPVLRGTDPANQAIAIANGNTVDEETLFGFVVLETSRAFDATAPIADTDPVTVMREGVIYVLLTGTATAGEPAFVGNATAQLGDIQGTTGTGLVQAPGTRFAESGTAGDLVALEVNL